MKVALFIPCYVDQFYPKVGIATLELLEKLGVEVDFPLDQTCCGQPMANSGCETDGNGAANLFVENFKDYDYIVGPTGSCVLHVREHFNKIQQTEEVKKVRAKTYELCEFLVDVLKVEHIEAEFPHKVGLHLSCHGLRGMRLGQSSEIVGQDFSKMRGLLEKVKGIELIELDRKDECCGFGGTFAVTEEAVSVKMGKDRVADHVRHGAEVLTGGDMSCLMHLGGIISRKDQPLKIMHIAEILNGVTL
ncbi:(Fe-S)-binding protein [Chondrinema litorale]|uniref:(Fe-S)-binding protein n=1 Tax=Chondrinema litorale TaxID=2994555 RepID=UPI0025438A8E|nr:(Fe-S)-binding protein [Chondrinema litorale]UZR94168.1 (Fe-S)-binding protein [Chondrinema litorale]